MKKTNRNPMNSAPAIKIADEQLTMVNGGKDQLDSVLTTSKDACDEMLALMKPHPYNPVANAIGWHFGPGIGEED